MRHLTATGLTVLALLCAALAPASVNSPAVADSAKPFTVSQTMLMNDPTHHRGQISRQLRTYINKAPKGSTISIMSFFLASSITWPALRAAYKRGVNIRAVIAGGDHGVPTQRLGWEGMKLQELIQQGRAKGRTGSWVVWTKKAGRGAESGSSTMHAKMWQFSQVGRTRKITMIGSYNNADLAAGRSYSAMVTLTDPKLYAAGQKIFTATARDRRDGANPQRRYAGKGWSLYAMPSLPITPGNDPVMDRLAGIPGNADTRMTIAMFSWQGRRGRWIAQKLAKMVRNGAKLTLVVGPDVEGSVVRTLRAAGAKLEDGCWRTGRKDFPYTFTHDKEMTATWVKDGKRRYGAWLGSDDWGNGEGGSSSDQVVIGLSSQWAFKRLNQLLAPQIAHTPDILSPCNPV